MNFTRLSVVSVTVAALLVGWPVILTGWPVTVGVVEVGVVILSSTGLHLHWLGVVTGISAASTGGILVHS